MNNFKKILLSLFSLFLLYRTFDLINGLSTSNPYQYNDLEIFIIGFLISLFTTGIFAFLGFVFPTNRILPSKYYVVKNPRAIKTVYKILGIKYFRFLLLLFFWGHKKNRKNYFDGTKRGIQNFVFQTKQSEFGHLAAFVVVFIITIYLLSLGYYKLCIIMSIINIIGNAFPVILQRSHRIRIQKMTIKSI